MPIGIIEVIVRDVYALGNAFTLAQGRCIGDSIGDPCKDGAKYERRTCIIKTVCGMLGKVNPVFFVGQFVHGLLEIELVIMECRLVPDDAKRCFLWLRLAKGRNRLLAT
jgi:hypothetical protein